MRRGERGEFVQIGGRLLDAENIVIRGIGGIK
jgi:hypothetical protein